MIKRTFRHHDARAQKGYPCWATILPDVRLSWRDVWLGALFTAVLCGLGARVFGIYLSWSGNQKYAGAVGALIALIIWVDIMAIFTLLGARLNRVLYDRRGKVLRPYRFAAQRGEEVLLDTEASDAADLADDSGSQKPGG